MGTGLAKPVDTRVRGGTATGEGDSTFPCHKTRTRSAGSRVYDQSQFTDQLNI